MDADKPVNPRILQNKKLIEQFVIESNIWNGNGIVVSVNCRVKYETALLGDVEEDLLAHFTSDRIILSGVKINVEDGFKTTFYFKGSRLGLTNSNIIISGKSVKTGKYKCTIFCNRKVIPSYKYLGEEY